MRYLDDRGWFALAKLLTNWCPITPDRAMRDVEDSYDPEMARVNRFSESVRKACDAWIKARIADGRMRPETMDDRMRASVHEHMRDLSDWIGDDYPRPRRHADD